MGQWFGWRRYSGAIEVSNLTVSLRKQPTFGDATTSFPAKWRLRNKCKNSMLVTCHYPDMGSASDWSCSVGNLIQPIRSTTQIWVLTRHQYGISALVSQTSFGGETTGSVAKCRLFSQASKQHIWSLPWLQTELDSTQRRQVAWLGSMLELSSLLKFRGFSGLRRT